MKKITISVIFAILFLLVSCSNHLFNTGIRDYLGSFASESFTITFDSNGGEGVMQPQVVVGDAKAVLDKNTFIRDKYAFVGWSTDRFGNEDTYVDEADILVSKDITLYAQWSQNANTITFNSNTGSGIMDKQTVATGVESVINKNTFVHSTKRFNGWSTSVDGNADGNSYKDEGKITIDKDITLYAQWVDKTNILFDKNNAAATGEMTSQVLESTEEEFLNINTYVLENYKFVGWNTENDGSGDPYADGGLIDFTTSDTLYAQWALEDNIFTITFDGGDGRVVDSGSKTYTQFVLKNKSAQLKPKTFENGNTTFIAWTTQENGSGTTYQNNETVQAINQSLTLYAQWGYTVDFFTDGGSSVASQKIIINKTFDPDNLPSSPTKEGYTFIGWFKEADHRNLWNFDSDTVIKDTTLYAKWEKIEYTITYHNNGETSEQKVLPLTPTALIANSKQVEGKLFIAWNTLEDGTGKNYNDTEVVSLNGPLVLYAQWRTALTITFNSNGGEGNMESLLVPSSTSAKLTKNTFTHSNGNNTFTGWNTSATGNGKHYADEDSIIITSNTILYAQWASDVWVITFDANDGAVPNTDPVVTEYTQNIGKNTSANLQLNNFVLEGSEFDSWNTNKDGTGRKYSNNEEISPENDIHLYAQWKTIITITYNQNWGSNLETTQNIIAGSPTTLQKNLFERAQYYFTGWNTQPNGNGDGHTDEQTNVTFNSDIKLYAQWVIAPYSNNNTIVSNGYNLKVVKDGSGTTVKWLYNGKEIDLQDIYSANIKNGINLSSYRLINARDDDGNYLGTGTFTLEGGLIRGVEGMNTLSIKGDISIGSGNVGGIILTKDNQLTIAGELTGNNAGILIRSHSIKQGAEIANVNSGGNPISKLNITDTYGSLPVQVEYKNNKLIALGQLGMTPPDRVEWEGDTFSIPEIVLGVSGTIFSLSTDSGYFTVNDQINIADASVSMAIPKTPKSDSPTDSYVTTLTPGISYTYVQFFPSDSTATFPAESASEFVRSLTFTPNNTAVGMSVKINLETVSLNKVNTTTTIDGTKVTYFNGSFYQLINNNRITWTAAYNAAKTKDFNGLNGYLMNITSEAENNFIYDRLLGSNSQNGWIGGTRYTSENGIDPTTWGTLSDSYEKREWRWAGGPEANEIFYYGKKVGSDGDITAADIAANDKLFHSWASGEPNDSPAEEFAHYYAETVAYKWNDFANTNPNVHYYFVEYTPYGDLEAIAKAAFASELYIKQ